VGVPVMTLASECGSDLEAIVWTTALLQTLVTAAGPVLVLLVLGGVKALKGMGRVLLFVEAAFLGPWLLAARFLGGELPDILGGIGVIAVLAALARRRADAPGVRECLLAWMPFALVVAFLSVNAAMPAAVKRFVTPGALVLAAGFAGAAVQGMPVPRSLALLGRTAVKYRTAFITICLVLALARVMGRSGMVGLIAESLVETAGSAYPWFSTALGAIGGFVTGSGTSSCVLFGRLQADVAAATGGSRELLAAANVMGAGIGKMICPQSIAIGAAAAGIAGSESEIFRKALPWFLAVLAVASAVTAAAALLSIV
jgi:lactate permease